MSNKPKHKFIFSPGRWIGEGKIAFSYSPNTLRFYTEWMFESANPTLWTQTVEIQGEEEKMKNTLSFFEIKEEGFSVELQNSLVEKVRGKGVIDSKIIAWEFKEKDRFEGFETFELQDNGDYLFHAEYFSTEHYRTVIDGRLWLKEV